MKRLNLLLLLVGLPIASTFGQSFHAKINQLHSDIAKSQSDSMTAVLYIMILQTYLNNQKLDSVGYYLEKADFYSQRANKARPIVGVCRMRFLEALLKNQYANARQYCHDGLEKAQKFRFHDSDAALLGDLARAWGRESRFDSALVYSKKSMIAAEALGEARTKAWAIGIHASLLANMGSRARAIPYYNESLRISESNGWDGLACLYLGNLCNAYQEVKDYERLLQSAQRLLDISTKIKDNAQIGSAHIRLGSYFSELNDFSKALKHFETAEKFLHNSIDAIELTNLYSNLAETQVRVGQIEQAEKTLEKLAEIAPKANPSYSLPQLEKIRASVFLKTKQFDKTKIALNKALELAEKSKNPELLELVWGTYTEMFLAMRDTSSAFLANQKWRTFQDSVFNATALRRILQFEAEAQFEKEQLKKDHQIAVAQQKEAQTSLSLSQRERELLAEKLRTEQQEFQLSDLENEREILGLNLARKSDSLDRQTLAYQLAQAEKATQLAQAEKARQAEIQQRKTAAGIFTTLLMLAALTILIFRYQAKLRQNRLQAEKTESELRSLRAMINPHFFFNALNALNAYILKNEPSKASNYLGEFSSLMRKTLDNAAQQSIALADEIALIENYVGIENRRFEPPFQFKIEVDEQVDIFETFVPSMILQPFVENAIWHGIQHLPAGTGVLTLKIEKTAENQLVFRLEDNGIGRERAAEIRKKQGFGHRSRGMEITRERLEKLAAGNRVVFHDLKNEAGEASGTRVEIFINMI